MEMLFVFALVGLALMGGFVGLFLYLGHRNGRGDLVAPPKEFGKREYGQRPAIRPAPKPIAAPQERAPDPVPLAESPAQTAEELVAAVSEPMPVSVPESAPEPAPLPVTESGDGEIAPVWRREAPTGNARLSEACYTAEQYAEREVKALLLQNHPNRAFTHARRALKLSEEEAMDFVERVARGLRV